MRIRTCRQFLLGLSAAGTLTVIPLPALGSAQSLPKMAGLARIYAVITGPVFTSGDASPDAIMFDLREFSIAAPLSEIEPIDCESDLLFFRPSVPADNELIFEGIISEDLCRAANDKSIIKAEIPIRLDGTVEYMSFDMVVKDIAFVRTEAA